MATGRCTRCGGYKLVSPACLCVLCEYDRAETRGQQVTRMNGQLSIASLRVQQLENALRDIFNTPVSVLRGSPEARELQDIYDTAALALGEVPKKR